MANVLLVVRSAFDLHAQFVQEVAQALSSAPPAPPQSSPERTCTARAPRVRFDDKPVLIECNYAAPATLDLAPLDLATLPGGAPIPAPDAIEMLEELPAGTTDTSCGVAADCAPRHELRRPPGSLEELYACSKEDHTPPFSV
jgi:hypothetical protein